MKQIIVIGACGRMGKMICEAVNRNPDMCLVGAVEGKMHPNVGGMVAGRNALGGEQSLSCRSGIIHTNSPTPI